MLQRSPVLQAAGTVLIITAVVWLGRAHRNGSITKNQENLPSQVPALNGTARAPTAGKYFQKTPIAVAGSAHAIRPASLGRISDLLQQKQKLGPAERERDDEIRRTLLALLADENAAAITQMLSAQFRGTEFSVAAFERWASADTLGAMLWLVQQPAQIPEQTHALAAALSKDPALLEIVCAQLPSSPWREALLEDISRAVLPGNPGDAIRLAQQMQIGPERTRALLRIADDWTARDPVAASHWITSEPDIFLRDELILAGSTALASTNPEEAFAWTTAISSPATFERALGQVANLWTSYAPQRADEFIERIDTPHPNATGRNLNLSR